MKRSCRFLLCAVMTGGAATHVAAQPAPAPAAPPRAPTGASSIPQTLKDATNLNAADRTTIATAVNAQVTRLLSEDASAISAAREALINEVVSGNRQAVGTPTFLDAYAEALNAALVKSIAGATPHAKLNAAIVVARVAEAADNSQLRQIAMTFVQDDAQPVALWGVRASKWIIPSIVRNPILANDVALRNAVPAAVKKHTKGVLAGDIVREAYEALTLDAFNPSRRMNITQPMIAGILPHLHQLMRLRVDGYGQGIPANPIADLNGVNFLLETKRWAAQSKEQRLASVQLMSDLLALSAQQAAAATNPTLQTEVVRVVDLVAGAISILGGYPDVNAPPVTVAADAVKVKGIAPQAKAEAAQAIYPALKAVKDFAALKAPPRVTGNEEPTTEPTTLPTTTTAPTTRATTRATTLLRATVPAPTR